MENIKVKNEFVGLFKDIKKEIDYYIETFVDTPEDISGWGHDYFCDIDGGALIFNLETPTMHKCPVCNKVYSGGKYDRSWKYIYRYNVITSLQKSAYIYLKTEDKKYLDFIIKILDFYSDNYENFKLQSRGYVVTDPNVNVGGAAKIMPQGLNEAIMLIRIVNALEMVKNSLDKKWIEKINKKLFIPAIELLDKQRIRIHNIALWIGTSIATVGLFTENKQLVDSVYNGEFGIKNQIAKGFTEDGFWYEGSIHYNYFSLEGTLNFLFFSEKYAYPVDEDLKERVLKILHAPYYYSFDNLVLPNPNDGWPNLSLKTYTFLYYIAYGIYGKKIEKLINTIEASKIERIDVALSKPYYFENKIPLERVIYAENLDISSDEENKLEKATTKNFEKSSFAILKNDDINVFFKYGHQTQSHAHPDKMTIETYIKGKCLSRDLSNPGYGSVICNEWNRMSVSHNTVVINGENLDCIDPGKVVKFNSNYIEAESSCVYKEKDATYRRSIELLEDGFVDKFEILTKEITSKDWVFHIEKDVKLLDKLELKEDELGINKNGYEHLKEIKSASLTGKIELNFDFYGEAIILMADLTDKKLFIAKSYDNPADNFRTTIIIRGYKENEKFSVEWKLKK